MPWTCPACNSRVGDSQNGDPLPTVGIVYRCPVCRLDVTFDPRIQKMRPVPEKPPERRKKSNAA